MKRIYQGGVYTHKANMFVVDDFGNAVALSDDQVDTVLDAYLNARAILASSQPC